jgi:UDP:flavonoid glycosyltransferase YjiC (YdhE family)
MRNILFFGEATSLAHVVRPMVLAAGLDPARYQAAVACDRRYDALLPEQAFERIPLHSIASEAALESVRQGRPIFDVPTLDGYVQEDLRILERVQPDVVVGDMRTSLTIAARIAGVPLVTLINAQWSPYAPLEVELPETPLSGLVCEPLEGISNLFFRLTAPIGMAFQAGPLNFVRLKYGMPPLDPDMRRMYCQGDFVVHPDIPEIVPTTNAPANFRYIGPIQWSPAVELPEWWEQIPGDRPIVCVNLGSSGAQQLLPVILEALESLDVYVIAATANRCRLDRAPKNAWVADYLPGSAAAARSRMVICNGGTMSGQQAIAAGTPFLGIATNLDQVMFSLFARKAGVAQLMHERRVEPASIRREVTSMLADDSLRDRAASLAQTMRQYDPAVHLDQVLSEID